MGTIPVGLSWAESEFQTAQLGDTRRTARLIQLAAQRGAQPHASIAQSGGSAADTKAAYRFYENTHIKPAAILDGHRQATAARVRPYRVVLAPQDTTELNYSTHPTTRGLGVLNDLSQHGLLMHSTLLVTPARECLGLAQVQWWARDASELGKRHSRRARPIEDKESYKWLSSLQALAELQATVPNTQLISVADREADIYDLFLEADHLAQALLVRAAWNRRVVHPERYLWQTLEIQAVAGSVTLQLPRRDDQPAREATLSIRYAPITVRPPAHRAREHLPPLMLWAVLAQETQPPNASSEPLEWLLLTTVPISNFDSAAELLQWYTCRWLIEVYHKILKSGCRVEARQFADDVTLQRYLALDCVVAWRVLFLTMQGRVTPDLPCDALFAAHEWQALYCFTQRVSVPPDTVPTLHDAVGWIAQLGGFLDRSGDGEPGVMVIWRGLQRLHDIATAWQVFQVPSPPAASPLVGKD